MLLSAQIMSSTRHAKWLGCHFTTVRYRGLVALFCLWFILPVTQAWSDSVDQVLIDAKSAEASGDYLSARVLYHRYLESAPAQVDRRALTLRSSILGEVVRYGTDAAVPLLLEALTAREAGDIDTALELLREVSQTHTASALHDDALYLMGYIALMDRVDFDLAHQMLRRVQDEYPTSTYFDTALYSEAIALEQLGNTKGAQMRFVELRDRHTRFSFGLLDQHWPIGTVMSRYWFDRATRRLEILAARADGAALLTGRTIQQRGNILKVSVNVDGVDLVLLLQPSQTTSGVIIKDSDNVTVAHPETRYYSGRVEGDEQSWARVALTGDSIEGIVMSYQTRYVLTSDSLVGTIEYYQPKSSTRAALPGLQDYVLHPPKIGDESVRRVVTGGQDKIDSGNAVNRVAHMAIVIDSQYNDYYGGQGLTRALSFLNIADGIYREDFGLALQVESAIVFADRALDPMNLGPVTLETTLRRFREYRLAHAADLPEVSLVYLFTGNQNSDQAIGLAWIGAACRLDGFDVGVTTPSLFGDLLLTHELGHSLGAQHDTDTACSSATNRLMWPRISSLTEQEFTHCSVDVVQNGISQSCHSDALDISLDVQLPDTTQIEAIIRNTDLSRSVSDTRLILDRAAVPFVSVPPQCIETGESELECRTGSLGPGESITLGFGLESEQPPSMSFIDVYPENNAVQVDLTQTTDGATAIEIAAVETEAGTGQESVGSVQNGVTAQSGAAVSGVGRLSGPGVLLLLLMTLWQRRVVS